MIPEALKNGPTWVVATESSTERWAETLRANGWTNVVSLAWGRAHPLVSRSRVDEAVQTAAPDVVLLTSQEALTCLGETPVPGWRAACIGHATMLMARARGFRVETGAGGPTLSVEPFTAEAFAKHLLQWRNVQRVLWLRGRDAREELAKKLQASGVRVDELVTYAVDAVSGFDEALHAAPAPTAVAIGSPRAAHALAASLQRTSRHLPSNVMFVPMGPTTARALEDSGFHVDKGVYPIHVFGREMLGLPFAE